MGKLVSYLILGLFAVFCLYYLITMMQTIAEPSVILENISFVDNDTYYDLGHNPTNSDLILYYFANTTFPIPVSLYSASTTQVKVLANGTDAYPNVTNGSSTFYYGTYTYQQSATVWGIDFNFIGFLVFIGACIFIVYKLTTSKE